MRLLWLNLGWIDMTTKSRTNVNVVDTETEIIESTNTNKSEERRFAIGNGEEEIIATLWGSNDNQSWEEVESKTIISNGYEIIILGPNHFWHVKLTGKTTSPGKSSIIDGYLTYTEP